MVTIGPPKFNLGSQLGAALGQGAQTGLQSGMQLGLNRGMLQQALGKVKNLAGQEGTKPLDLMLGLMEAGAGIPGSEKYLSTLLPAILSQSRAQNIFGNESGQLSPQQQTANALGVPYGDNAAATRPETLGVGLTAPQSGQAGGFLPQIQTPQQIDNFAKNYAIQMGDPSEYQTGYQIALNQNKLAESSRNALGEQAVSTGKITQAELPEYMQLIQRYSHLNDLNEITTSATRDFEKYRNAKHKLDNAIFPGFARGALQKGAAGFAPSGLLLKYLAGGTKREQALKQIQPSVKDLINLGFEGDVRRKLASEHLSPTEIEEIIHPLSPKQMADLKAFPSSEKVPEKIRQQKLSNFFLENVTPETSLLSLRHQLWNDKGYDWKSIGPSIREAMTKGLQLTPQQQAEMGTVEGNPPIQSLTEIFRDWGRWIDYLRGSK